MTKNISIKYLVKQLFCSGSSGLLLNLILQWSSFCKFKCLDVNSLRQYLHIFKLQKRHLIKLLPVLENKKGFNHLGQYLSFDFLNI